MINCAYHIENRSAVNCNGCGKPLCSACDHRIKGFPFCQDCIVDGVDMLRSNNQMTFVPIVKNQTSPFISAILSLLCPGLGAAYNGQTSKGLIHFLVFIGLFQMAILSGGMAVFVFGFFGMWIYGAFDSWRTAQLIRSGITPNHAEDVLVQRFSGNTKLWGVVLTVIGVSFVLQAVFGFDQVLTRFMLPLLLIGLGFHLLRKYGILSKAHKSRRNSVSGNLPTDYVDSLNSPRFDSSRYDTQPDDRNRSNIRR